MRVNCRQIQFGLSVLTALSEDPAQSFDVALSLDDPSLVSERHRSAKIIHAIVYCCCSRRE